MLGKALTKLYLVAALVVFPIVGSAQNLSSEEQQIKEYVHQHFEDTVSLLERAVNINSGSLNSEGVREVAGR